MAYSAVNPVTVGAATKKDHYDRVFDNTVLLKTCIDDTGDIRFVDATELTIASDAITVTQNYHRVDTQADAAADDLSTITAGASVAAGFLLVLRAENVARVVTVKDGVGNVQLNGGDLALDATDKVCVLVYDGTNWRGGSLVSRGGGGLSQDFRGVHLRTHPDADSALSKVMLVHADAINFVDANGATKEVTSGLDRLVMDMTVAGAGGLSSFDATERASTYYKIYAIRKSSDGTANLLGHKAKDYFLDESQTSTNGTFRLRNITEDASRVAQTFDTDVTGYVEKIDVKLTKVGSPTGRVWVSLYATSAGAPTGSALATSDKLDVSLISTSAQYMEFVFRNPVSLTASTTYALSVEGDWTNSNTDYVRADTNNTNPYAAGNAYLFTISGSAWSSSAGNDLVFKVYVTENDAAISAYLPSGYDQWCHIGWVRNNGSSNLDGFVAQDRHVTLIGQPSSGTGASGVLGSFTSAIPTLTSLEALFPPTPVMFFFGASSDASGRKVRVGGVPNGYADPAETEGAEYGAMTIQTFANDNTNVQTWSPYSVMTEFQAAYISTSAGTSYVWPGGYTW